jgi:hypothetical protein
MEEEIIEPEPQQYSNEEGKSLLENSNNFEIPVYEENNQTKRDEILNEPKLYSESIISIMIPVMIAMFSVIWAVQTLSPVLESTPIYSQSG